MSATAGAVALWSGAGTFVAVFLVAATARRPLVHRALVRRPVDATPRGSRRSASIVALVGAIAIASLVIGPELGLLAIALGLLIGVRRHRRRTERQRRAVEDAMPDTIELLVLCVHAGRSPTQAVLELARVAPPGVRGAFAGVELQLHRGRALADAIGELRSLPGPEGRELAAAIAGADRDGLPLAPVLDRLAAEARAARRRSGDAAAKRLPVRLSFPLVVCTLPSFVLLAIAPAVLGAVSTLRGRAP